MPPRSSLPRFAAPPDQAVAGGAPRHCSSPRRWRVKVRIPAGGLAGVPTAGGSRPRTVLGRRHGRRWQLKSAQLAPLYFPRPAPCGPNDSGGRSPTLASRPSSSTGCPYLLTCFEAGAETGRPLWLQRRHVRTSGHRKRASARGVELHRRRLWALFSRRRRHRKSWLALRHREGSCGHRLAHDAAHGRPHRVRGRRRGDRAGRARGGLKWAGGNDRLNLVDRAGNSRPITRRPGGYRAGPPVRRHKAGDQSSGRRVRPIERRQGQGWLPAGGPGGAPRAVRREAFEDVPLAPRSTIFDPGIAESLHLKGDGLTGWSPRRRFRSGSARRRATRHRSTAVIFRPQATNCSAQAGLLRRSTDDTSMPPTGEGRERQSFALI